MKLYYTRTWEAEISDKDILNTCKPHFNVEFSSLTRKNKNYIVDKITEQIINKYTSYEFLKLPMAFLQPLKTQVKQHLESFPIMIASMKERK